MRIPTKHRRWILAGALLLTVAAAASVGGQGDQDGGVVQADTARVHVPHRKAESLAAGEPSMTIPVEMLNRPVLSEDVKDMFSAKSWYVPPPPPRVKPPPSAPPLPFVYIGKMQGEGNLSTVFLERQSLVYMVHEGQAIDRNYRVDTINPPLMTLTYLPLDIKQTMQIGEAN